MHDMTIEMSHHKLYGLIKSEKQMVDKRFESVLHRTSDIHGDIDEYVMRVDTPDDVSILHSNGITYTTVMTLSKEQINALSRNNGGIKAQPKSFRDKILGNRDAFTWTDTK